jgi:hypothetical protein
MFQKDGDPSNTGVIRDRSKVTLHVLSNNKDGKGNIGEKHDKTDDGGVRAMLKYAIGVNSVQLTVPLIFTLGYA